MTKTVIVTLSGDMPDPEGGTLYDYLINELDNHGIQAYVTEINAPHAVVEAAPDMFAELEWITRCAKFRGPANTSCYAIADERMNAARLAVAKAKQGPA